jgi:hypothetical protein
MQILRNAQIKVRLVLKVKIQKNLDVLRRNVNLEILNV